MLSAVLFLVWIKLVFLFDLFQFGLGSHPAEIEQLCDRLYTTRPEYQSAQAHGRREDWLDCSLAVHSVVDFKVYSGVGSDAYSNGVCCWESVYSSTSPPAPSLPCSSPSAPQLIPGSLHCYRSVLASHQRAEKSSPPFLTCQSLPLLYPSIICFLFFPFLCLTNLLPI